MDVARNRLVPVSVQGLVTARGQRSSLNPGSRTRVPRGSQSPVTPWADMARTWMGPNAEAPKLVRGSTEPMAVLESSSMRPGPARESTVLKLPSTAATSTFSVRGKLAGTRDLRKKTRRPSTGRSSGLPRWTGDGGAEGSSWTPLFRSVICGRGRLNGNWNGQLAAILQKHGGLVGGSRIEGCWWGRRRS